MCVYASKTLLSVRACICAHEHVNNDDACAEMHMCVVL